MTPVLVAGIGTDVGKTLVSAILVEMLGANYLKPVSTGSSDTDYLTQLLGLKKERVYPEMYSFKTPASPHYSAFLEQKKIEPLAFPKELQDPLLIIESAGGVLVPINEELTTLDWFGSWPAQWILVSRHYLGSINHTLTSYAVLKQKGVHLLGLIFNGKELPHHENFILRYTHLPLLGRIDEEKQINQETIKRYARQWKENEFWKTWINKHQVNPQFGTPTHKSL